MTPTEYQQRVLMTAVSLSTQQEYVGLCALGLAGELGEVIALFENGARFGQPLDPQRVQSETGDVLWYVALLCTVLQLPFEQIVAHACFVQPTDVEHMDSHAFSASIQVGVMCDLLKKYLYHRNGKSVDRERIYSALCMLTYSLAVFGLFAGATLDQIMQANSARLEARHAQGFTPRYDSDSGASR